MQSPKHGFEVVEGNGVRRLPRLFGHTDQRGIAQDTQRLSYPVAHQASIIQIPANRVGHSNTKLHLEIVAIGNQLIRRSSESAKFFGVQGYPANQAFLNIKAFAFRTPLTDKSADAGGVV